MAPNFVQHFYALKLILSRKGLRSIMTTFNDGKLPDGREDLPCIVHNALLESNNLSNTDSCEQTGVSTRYALEGNAIQSSGPSLHWYALRTTYGREKKAYDFIIEHGGIAFYPTILEDKIIKGKRKTIEVSRIPNIFFAYGTEESIRNFVYDNVHLPFLRFYYKRISDGRSVKKIPMIVPDNQINSLKIICEAEANNDVLLLQSEEPKFKKGEKVIVKDGPFKGVSGIVARFQGQQRVGLVIEGLITAATAYIPSAFLERTNNNF